jgi:hypothetical protein
LTDCHLHRKDEDRNNHYQHVIATFPTHRKSPSKT